MLRRQVPTVRTSFFARMLYPLSLIQYSIDIITSFLATSAGGARADRHLSTPSTLAGRPTLCKRPMGEGRWWAAAGTASGKQLLLHSPGTSSITTYSGR